MSMHDANGLGPRLRWADALRSGTAGLRQRPGRTLLTALGIAIGVASLVAVLAISASSRAEVIAEIDRLGPDLLTVGPGDDLYGDRSTLPPEAPAMIRSIDGVEDAAGFGVLDTTLQGNGLEQRPGEGVLVAVAEEGLLDTLDGSLAAGRFLDGSTDLPVSVLGATAAERLGIHSLDGGPVVFIAGRPFQVIGILEPLPLHPDLDRAALVGAGVAESLLGVDVVPTSVVVRAHPDRVDEVRAVLARTTSPAAPNEVEVSRPSDALDARAAVDSNLQRLLLGLGGVALLVGGVGIANVMVISVMERRGEIGLRRAIGATRTDIATQFVLESSALAALGGVFGVVLGMVVTGFYIWTQGWPLDAPFPALAGGVGVSVALGAVAGLHPALRAARLDPADAVRPRA